MAWRFRKVGVAEVSGGNSLPLTRSDCRASGLLPVVALLVVQKGMLLGVDSPSSEITPVMWAMGAIAVVMVVDLVILGLIFRDAMEDDAHWVHAVGGVVLWIGLALCARGFKYLAGTFPEGAGAQGDVNGDRWILMGFVVTCAATIPTLILLGLNVRGILLKIRRERKAAESARRLRGTLGRR